MIPLRDTQEISIFPVATIIIILINVIIFAAMYITAFSAKNPQYSLTLTYVKYGLVPYELTTHHIIYPSITPIWSTLITSMFIHGGVGHILGNMWFFWIFGNNVEDYLGSAKFVLFYLAGGIIAALTQIAINPVSKVPVIGASGAIAAVMGAYFYLFPRSNIKTLLFVFYFITFVEIPAPFFLLFWFIMQLIPGLTPSGTSQGVAFWAHIGGFVFGLIAAVIIKKMKESGNYDAYY
jgi:membrane associated rhomboid family serine protease